MKPMGPTWLELIDERSEFMELCDVCLKIDEHITGIDQVKFINFFFRLLPPDEQALLDWGLIEKMKSFS